MKLLINFVLVEAALLVWGQENAQSRVSEALLECYNNTRLLLEENRLPHTIHALIAIIRKIEDNPEIERDMDLRKLSVALLHRFRQDGIVLNPEAVPQEGVTPYATDEFQFYRHSEMLKLIPGNANSFNNNSINVIERCSLHSMISSSIDTIERSDKSTCRLKSNEPYHRIWKRSIELKRSTESENKRNNDVETLTAEEIELISKNNKHDEDDAEEEKKDNNNSFDPNLFYSELPSNHPENGKLQMPTRSKCPLESGVLQTDWGVVSGGALIAGIAAALQSQNIRIGDLMSGDWQGSIAYDSNNRLSASVTLDNKWIATLAGDLAEVALRQGPSRDDDTYKIGGKGYWNSSYTPKYYFLDNDEGLEFTEAEVRGDLDGLILATHVASWYSNIPTLRLSQIIDMYYSDRGVFNYNIRACNRRNLLTLVAPNDTTSLQTSTAALVLNENTKLPKGTLAPEKIEKFSVEATNELFKFIPLSMNNDKTCIKTHPKENLFNRLAVNLTIIIDTNWPFNLIKTFIAYLLERSDINKYASNYRLINGWNGNVMINTSNSILDFYEFNETNYNFHIGQFDLPKSLDILKELQMKKLNYEQYTAVGGTPSDIVLIVTHSSTSISHTDKEYSLETILKMREDLPDANIIFLTGGSKDTWSNLVKDPANDIISIRGSTGKYNDIIEPIENLLNRMKQIPKRLINSQCGASYSPTGESASFTDYLEPSGIQFYRLHPNYFYKQSDYQENLPTVKIHGIAGGGILRVCSSRNLLHINSSEAISSCTTILSDNTHHSITVDCNGANYIHECSPLYLSIMTNKTTSTSGGLYQCTDPKFCRYPDMVKFTISYEKLLCTSGVASSRILSQLLLITFTIFSIIISIISSSSC